MLRQGARGFTLLEMLIVVAIMMVLMAILFPVAMAAYENANRTACASNLQLISQRIEMYRQDYLVYPAMPNYVGLHGIPQGGVTGLALASADLTPKSFWCNRDPFPGQYPAALYSDAATQAKNGMDRDLTNSTYQAFYNYYGYVTDTDGMPFPVTTIEAFRYFFSDPNQVYTATNQRYPDFFSTTDLSIPNPNWDLGLVVRKPKRGDIPEFVPRGLTQALWNTWAPADTLVTYCTHHPSGKPSVVPAVNMAGEALLLRPIRAMAPVKATTNTYDQINGSASIPRKPATDPLLPIFKGNWKPPIDWRVNRGAYRLKKDSGVYQVVEDSKYISDSPQSPLNMPVVETYYRRVTAKLGANGLTPDTGDPGDFDYAWYDTGVDLDSGDMVMVVATAKWNFFPTSRITDRAFWQGRSTEYDAFFSDSGALWFTADGNPVEVTSVEYNPQLLLPEKPHCLLVGFIGTPRPTPGGDFQGKLGIGGDRQKNFIPLGSRSSYIVPKRLNPSSGLFEAYNGTLKVTLNDISGGSTYTDDDPGNGSSYQDNSGWCELWIAVYRANSRVLPEP
ncbi:MAG: type II secretion system protein [Armatimonadota bacterium]